MQPTAYPLEIERLLGWWQEFALGGQLAPHPGAPTDPSVLRSWRRCAPRLTPTTQPKPRTVKGPALESLLRAQGNLVALGVPLIEDIYQYIEGSDSVVLLADGTACILSVIGDPVALHSFRERGIGRGTYWSEGQMGTNALGVALLDAAPVQVVGPEHYFANHHDLVTTAAPVHAVNGRIIGVIAVAGPVESASPHTLAMVMAAARSMTNQLQADHYLEEANRRLTIVNAVVDRMSDGVITWNSYGRVTHINRRAAELLGVRPASLLGHPILERLRLSERLLKALEEPESVQELEAHLELDGHSVEALVTLHPLPQGDGGEAGFLMLLRHVEEVRQLVHSQVGTHANIRLDNVVAYAPSMRPVMRQAHIAARGTAPVLLRGEGGAGKNHLARAIHNASARANRPFVSINCRAIPYELMMREFLGRQPNGAGTAQPSKFELAAGGTLMIDQIETLSLEMQTVLLQIIETGYVTRLGGTRPVRVDVRIIGATGVDLERHLEDNRFLPHLYYRFGVFNIRIPPLRQRLEDIPLLAEQYLARITRQSAQEVWIDDEAQEVLNRYPWPGNVRELESVLERALAHSHDNIIRVTDLPENVRRGRVLVGEKHLAKPVLSAEEAEREAIIRAGWACAGRVTDMARQLGIGRTTLWRKMKRYHIERSQFQA